MAIGRAIGGILGLCLGAYMVASTLPGALTAIAGANTTGWDSATAAIWPIMGVIIVFGAISVIMPDM